MIKPSCLRLRLVWLSLMFPALLSPGWAYQDQGYRESSDGIGEHVEGVLEIIVEDDFQSLLSDTEYRLRTAQGLVELVFGEGDTNPRQITSGSLVGVRGRRLAPNRIAALQSHEEVSPGLAVISLAPNSTTGEQKILALLINFEQDPRQPFTVDEVRSLLFADRPDSAYGYFKENSSDQAILTGDVRGWFRIPYPPEGACQLDAVSHAADSAARAAGVPLDDYSRLIYYVIETPRNGICAAGRASIGGKPSRAWINGTLTPHVTIHELGHNFGLFHSNGLYWGYLSPTLVFQASLVAEAINYEGSDYYTVMGGLVRHLHAREKSDLQWGRMLVVDTPGDYELRASALPGLGIKGITIPAPGLNYSFDVEARKKIGPIDGSIEAEAVLNGALIRVRLKNDNDNYLLDATVRSVPTLGATDFQDAGLAVGKSFTDRTSGITITTVSSDAEKIVVNVWFGQPMADPRIASAHLEGKKLIVLGENFSSSAVILLNGEERPTVSAENPARLISKKAGKKIRPGDKIRIRDSDGFLSAEFVFEP